MNRQVNLPTPERMQVIALHDPAVEAHGHRPGSPYVAHVWLSTLGPASTWMWTHISRIASVRPSTVIDMADLAATLGLSTRLGPNSPMSRTVARVVYFDAARRAGDTLAVRLALPDLPTRRLAQLPASVRLAHQHLSGSHRTTPTPVEPATAQIAEGVAL